MENFSSFERIIGSIPEEEKDKLVQQRGKVFNDPNVGMELEPDLKNKVRQKTAEELAIIDLVNEATNDLLKKYDLPELNVPEQRIIIADKAKTLYLSVSKLIIVSDQNVKIILAKKIAHEMIHLKSKNIFRYGSDKGGMLDENSVGIEAQSESGKKLFTNLNEAITEELAKQVCLQLLENDFFSNEKEQTEKLRMNRSDAIMEDGNPLFNKDTYYAEAEKVNGSLEGAINELKRGKLEINTESFTYPEERKVLEILINKIYEHRNNLSSSDKKEFNLRTRTEVFNFFAKSMLTGDLRAVIKLIDHTFKKIGTTQKMLHFENKIGKDGKPFNDVDGQLKFVEDL